MEMKVCQAPAPSGIVMEMIHVQAASDTGVSIFHDLAAAIIHDGKTLQLGAEFHCLPLQGLEGCIGQGQLPQSQADRAGHECPGEDCQWPHQTVGVNWRFPVWLHPKQRHNRRNLCCQAAAREVSSSVLALREVWESETPKNCLGTSKN